MRFFYWFVTVLVAAVLADFAASNLEPVVVGLWPASGIVMRLYVVVLLALLLGFLAGEFVAWINGRHWRREARRRGRRIEALERQLAAAETRPAKNDAARLPVAAAPHD